MKFSALANKILFMVAVGGPIMPSELRESLDVPRQGIENAEWSRTLLKLRDCELLHWQTGESEPDFGWTATQRGCRHLCAIMSAATLASSGEDLGDVALHSLLLLDAHEVIEDLSAFALRQGLKQWARTEAQC
jgi:hypothetical protein